MQVWSADAVSLPSPLANTVKSQPDVVIFDGRYPGWPWITQGKEGTLYCVFREGIEHDFSTNGRALVCLSNDHGKSWSKPNIIADAPGVDDRNVAITEIAPHELVAVFNTYTFERASLAMITRSTNDGATWSSPVPIGEPNTRTKSAVLKLTDGAWLLPYYVAPGNGSLAARSTDQGRTWKTVRAPDAEGFVGDEWDVLEISPNRVIGILRNSHPQTDGFFWKNESLDGGQSWSAPRKTNVQSQRATSPAQLGWQNRMPVLVYADRRMVSVSAVTTHDPDFVNWDVDHRLPCYFYNHDQSPILDGSYPVSVQTGPNERFIVDYEIRPESRRITGYFVNFSPLSKEWEAVKKDRDNAPKEN